MSARRAVVGASLSLASLSLTSLALASLSLASLALVGCSGAPTPTPQIPQEPQSSERAISESFSIREKRRNAKVAKQPQSTFVDYESEIRYLPDRAALARMIDADTDADSSLRRDKRLQLEAQIDLLDQTLSDLTPLSKLIDDIAEYHSLTLAYYAKERAPGAAIASDTDWRAMSSKRLEVVKALRPFVKTLVSHRDYGGQIDALEIPGIAPDSPEGKRLIQATNEQSRIYNLMAHGGTFVVPEITRFVNETTELVTAKLTALNTAVLAKAPKATLEMEAHLRRGEERLPVTISPYTLVAGVGRGSKSPRVGVPSKQDLAKMEKAYEAYSELSKAINEAKALANNKDEVDKLKKQLVAAIKLAASNLKKGLQERLKTIVEPTSNVPDDVVAVAKTVESEIEQLQKSWQTFTDEAPSLSPLGMARAITTLTDQLQSTSLLKNLEDLGKKIETALSTATNQDSWKNLLTETQTQLNKEATALLKAIEDVPAIGGLASAFSSLRALAKIQGFGDMKPGAITSNPLTLDVAKTGVVDLNQTPAESGDRLEVTYTLTENPGAPANDQKKHIAHESHDVRKFGVYSTLKSQLLFYDRLHDGQSSFSAAPGIAYNFHYRPDGDTGVMDAIAPGVGISVSAPNFNGSTELAIGAQLTLFNDMLQFGYAYNISVNSNQEMFYFGLDLISVFQGMQ